VPPGVRSLARVPLARVLLELMPRALALVLLVLVLVAWP
jgi:hypothetical protein